MGLLTYHKQRHRNENTLYAQLFPNVSILKQVIHCD